MLQSKLFQNLTSDELEKLYSIGKMQNFAKEQFVVREDQEGDEFFWIMDGRVRIEISTPGESKTHKLNVLAAGDLFGERVLLGRKRRSASAIAQEESTLIMWKRSECMALFENIPHIGFRLMTNLAQVLSDRINDMNLHIRNNSDNFGPSFLKLLRSD